MLVGATTATAAAIATTATAAAIAATATTATLLHLNESQEKYNLSQTNRTDLQKMLKRRRNSQCCQMVAFPLMWQHCKQRNFN